MAQQKKNLNHNLIRLLRKVQKFLIEEPRRFNMFDGITLTEGLVNKPYNRLVPTVCLLEEPPCGTACCIAGAGYAIANDVIFDHTHVSWRKIDDFFQERYNMPIEFRERLFFTGQMVSPGSDCWPYLYSKMYSEAKTPLERACVGVARIEHFIATDGLE